VIGSVLINGHIDHFPTKRLKLQAQDISKTTWSIPNCNRPQQVIPLPVGKVEEFIAYFNVPLANFSSENIYKMNRGFPVADFYQPPNRFYQLSAEFI
jgi:hypothetical protein